MCVKNSDAEAWPAISRMLGSCQGGSVLRTTAGSAPLQYQPMPKPSPFVVSDPRRECMLGSIRACAGAYRASPRTMGEPEYASQRHMSASFLSMSCGHPGDHEAAAWPSA